jgi:hypothetical protein
MQQQDYYTYQLLLDLKVGKDWAVPYRTSSTFLYRPDQHRSHRSARALAHGVVADDFIRRV